MTTRNIGLSLGADLCWPAAYEEILKRLDLKLDIGGEAIQFACERVRPEPFDLQYTPKYDLVLDRITHWLMLSREWIKKIAVMDGVYVLNNPWSIQSMEKHTTYCAMMRLGFPVPKTWLIPNKYFKDEGDVRVTVERYNKLFRLEEVGNTVGYPSFIKPYDGGGWRGIKRVANIDDLHAAYDETGETLNHLQAGIEDYEVFVRGIGVGPQVNLMPYDPDKPLHDRYQVGFHFLEGDDWLKATRITRVINAFFLWDFNSCEMLKKGSVLHPIDFANACPDSQVTSLHYHFPWLVKALLRWSLFCAATKRKVQLHPNWDPFFEIADGSGSFDEQLVQYDALARAHFDTDRFEAFCAEHLGRLDEVAWEYFGTEQFRSVVQDKVAALFPAHEVKEFTNHFYGMIQFWRKTERDRLAQQES